MLTRDHAAAYVSSARPGWTVFAMSNGAKGIVPCLPGYPAGCITLGFTWADVIRKVKRMAAKEAV